MQNVEALMPNWVTTRCTVTGPSREVEDFWEKMAVCDAHGILNFDFKQIVPFPETVAQVSEEGEIVHELPDVAGHAGGVRHESWDDWGKRNWGTKWNSRALDVISEDPLQFRFDTALSFPTKIFEALARRYPTLRFECTAIEESEWFGGTGYFNPGTGDPTYARCEPPIPGLYEAVHGDERPPKGKMR
jgi:hypothetical protein